VKTQGRRGEVGAALHTDFPERFAERKRLFALHRDGNRREMELEDAWPHLGRMVLKFRGVETIEDAEALVGCEIQVPIEERAPLEAGSAYVSDLVGCAVVDGRSGSEIGLVEDVQFGAGEAPLLVVRSGAKERLIPLAAAYLKAFEPAQKRIEVLLPEGMLELDAPLSAEERGRQRGDKD
jgi:16S rRNA processing protein RimM